MSDIKSYTYKFGGVILFKTNVHNSSLRVFIVDDDEGILELLQESIHQVNGNCDIYGFKDASEAINAFEDKEPHIVVTDVVMPGEVNGIEFAQQILNMRSNVPVIMITGYGSKVNYINALQACTFGFIEKPISISDFVDTFQRAVQYKFAIIEDELIEKKKYLDKLMDVAPCGVFTVNQKSEVTSWNKYAEKTTGFKKEEVVGKRCIFLPTGDGNKKCKLCDNKLSLPGLNKRTSLKNKNGEFVPILKNYDRIATGDEYIECFLDISDLNKAEKDKDDLYLQLIQSSKLAAVGTLSAEIANEFKNPMTHIKSASYLIGVNSDDKQLLSRIEIIRSAVDRMKGVIDYLNEFSQNSEEGPRVNASNYF